MFYYAEINSEYQVINKYCLSEESTNPNYILITEDLYNNGNELGDIVGQFYNALLDVIEIVDPGWDMGQTCWMRYKDSQMRLSTKLDNMDKTTSLKADINHTHEGYANSNDLQVLEDVVVTKADVDHSHTEYALVGHVHDNYATQVALDALGVEVDGKADVSHTHSDYSATTHNHDSSYSPISHSHTASEIGAATSGHNHDSVYATITSLDELSSVVSSKANVIDLNSHASNIEIHISDSERECWNAKSDFSGNYNDLSNKPTIPSIDGLATETYVNTQIDAIDIPSTLSDLTTDSTHRVVTDVEKAAWNAKSNFSGSYNDLTNKPSIPSISGLATETYVDEAVSTKADSGHTHNNIYYTETEINDKLATKADSSHNHTGVYDVNGAAASALSSAQTYTDEAIDALSETVATKADASTLSSHTGNTAVHITSAERSKLSGIAEGANNYVLPSAGTSLGGVKSGGDVAISSGVITVNDDSHNHIISNVDGLQSALDSKAASGHNHDGVYYTETEIDTLLEGKANSSHTHTISNITNLQSTLDGKANTSHGTHVSYSTTAPVMDGTASVGSAATVARSDHKHPTDTSRAAQTDLDALKTVVAGKANASHTHTIANISNLQSTLDGKASSSHTHTVANISDLTATVTELNYMDGVTSNVQAQLDGKSATTHTHSYAGSSSVGGAATSANKLNTNAGDVNTPVYFTNGIPVPCTSLDLNTSGNAATATNVAWSGVTSKPSYYDAKAIKGITRNGTTFTYTCMDGTTGTFTQQDNNTTYSAATTSANGLMSSSDKSKLDGMVLATVSEIEAYLGI